MRPMKPFFLLGGMILWCSAGLFGDVDWVGTGGDGKWCTSMNWYGGQLPTSQDTVNIDMPTECTVTLSTGETACAWELIIGKWESAENRIIQDGGTCTVADMLDLGYRKDGSQVAHGRYELSGDENSTLTVGFGWVGDEGKGVIAQTGGCAEFKIYLILGWKGCYGSGGWYEGEGSYLISAGQLKIGTFCDVGGAGAGVGLLEVSGQGTQVTINDPETKLGSLNVGCYSFCQKLGDITREALGTGEFSQSGGTTDVWGWCYVGGSGKFAPNSPSNNGGHGTIGLSGGAFTVGRDFIVGAYTYVKIAGDTYGSGEVNVEGGTLSVGGSCYLGGKVAGMAGIGDLFITGGVVAVEGDLSVGTTTLKMADLSGHGMGTVVVEGGKLTVGSDVYVGGIDGDRAGQGELTVNGGEVDLGGDLMVGIVTVVLEGGTPCGIGTVAVEGGTLTVPGDVYVGGRDAEQAGEGLLVMTGGGLSVAGDLLFGTTQYELPDESLRGWGTLQVGDEEAEEETDATIQVGGHVVFGPRSSFHVVEPSTQPSHCTIATTQPACAVVIQAGADGGELDGLGKTKVQFAAADAQSQVKTIEVAGVDPTLEYLTGEDFCADNFVIDVLVVGNGDATGPVTLKFLDEQDNQQNESEALFVNTLTIDPHGTFDLDGLALYYVNGGDPKQFFMGDADLDGDVDFTDYQTLESNFGTESGMIWEDGDFDGDGDVDYDDYLILDANYGSGLRAGRGQEDSVELPPLPVLRDYDEDGDVDIDDLHILQQMEQP